MFVDKLKEEKKRKTAARKRLFYCTDVSFHVVYNLSHVKNERTYNYLDFGVLHLERMSCCDICCVNIVCT